MKPLQTSVGLVLMGIPTSYLFNCLGNLAEPISNFDFIDLRCVINYTKLSSLHPQTAKKKKRRSEEKRSKHGRISPNNGENPFLVGYRATCSQSSFI